MGIGNTGQPIFRKERGKNMQYTNILALNGSPKKRNSNTKRLLEPFLEGAEKAGAQTETLYTAELTIKDCVGCFTCWKRTPGCCIHKDDMPLVLEKIRQADLVVWATPLYHYGMTASLKRILERTLPLVKPYIVKDGEHYGHPSRYGKQHGNFLIANCGFPERLHFESLIQQFHHLSRKNPFLGAITCTTGEMLGEMDCSWYLEAMQRAGREIVEQGNLSADTTAILEKGLIPLETFLSLANASWNVPGDTPPTLEKALRGSQENS
jgi:multimeric flavodoxin WrbA